MFALPLSSITLIFVLFLFFLPIHLFLLFFFTSGALAVEANFRAGAPK